MTTSLLDGSHGDDQPMSASIRFLRIFVALSAILLCTKALGAGESELLLLGGSSLQPPVKRYLPGAHRTILFPSTVDSYGLTTPLLRPGKGGWKTLTGDSLERAAMLLATTDPNLIRDSRGVLEMAVLTTDSPLLATAVLTKGFLSKFSALFGPELILAIPARNKVYVFPKLANRLPAMKQIIRDDFLISPAPVSLELFELSAKGLRTVGTLDPDDR
jgi:hypothetical protein